MKEPSALERARLSFQPRLPKALVDASFRFEITPAGEAAGLHEAIQASFPHTSGHPHVTIVDGEPNLPSDPLTVGVVFSGGQAPGGHNVVAGLLDALKAINPESKLVGFLGGPKGVIKNKSIEVTPEVVARYRNTGGFDLIGSGRDKIEEPEDLASCRKTLEGLGCQALVVVGGDDSNTNAALLAEYFAEQGAGINVVGVPKTIDGDMKNDRIETSFGFDTAAKVFSELVGSICRDAASAKKYWHFIRLMGRAASHITLEVALQTQPNISIISEEAAEKGWTLRDVVNQVAEAIAARSMAGKNYGVLLIPEGLLEFLTDVRQMIDELGRILGEQEAYLETLDNHEDRAQLMNSHFSAEAAQVYNSLPDGIQEVLLRRDNHGNIPLSQVETESLLIDLVSDRIGEMKARGAFAGSFRPLGHFFGYEGRCVQPTNFDSNYCYTLGYTAAQLVRGGLSGYTVSATNLAAPVEEWIVGGVPVTSMLVIEERNGQPKPVIKKTLVTTEGAPFKHFDAHRQQWLIEDCYTFPGPIQYFGPPEVCDALTKTLELERKA